MPGSTPDPAKVRKAIAESKESSDGRVLKVIYLDEQGDPAGEWAPSQLPENPWSDVGETGKALVEPPFPLAQLVFLAEMHPVHSSALEQKTADVCGKGWTWTPLEEDNANEELKDEMEAWFEALAPDEFDMREVVHELQLDVETTGWGMFECARDPQGVVKRIYQVPSHTVKAHKNGFALCQARDSRKVWFRRWGATDINNAPVQINAKSGNIYRGSDPALIANDLFVIRRPSRRSAWYGIPGYVSAIGWITLALAARDDNLLFFANRREPRWAIILTGMSEDTEIEEDLRRAFTVDMKQPYRNVIVPVSGKDAKVTFEQLSDTAKDGSFEKLSERADKAIMIAHRVPGDRLANTMVGALGGNVAYESNIVYKEGVVGPSQEVLNSRLNRFISVEYSKTTSQEAKPGEKQPWQITMEDFDIRSDREDLNQAVEAFHANMTTLREARHRVGMPPLMVPKPEPKTNPDGSPVLDPMTGQQMMGPPEEQPEGQQVEVDMVESKYNDMLFTELPGSQAQAGQPGQAAQGVGTLRETNKARALESQVRELLIATRETQAQLTRAQDDE